MPHSKYWLVLGPLAALAAACASTPQHTEMASVKGTNVPTPPNVDRSKCDEKGKNVITADTNLDQKADVWKFYQSTDVGGQKTEVLTCKEVDLNHDGKVDLVYYYDDKGVVSMDQADTDFDGKFDMTVYYANGKKVRMEFDTNFDGRPDVWKYFEDEKLVRQERDTNNDGKVDEWEYYEAGKLDRIGYDTTGNGTVNKWDRAPEGEDTEGGGAAPAAGNGATPPAPAAAPAPTAPPPATSPPPAKAAAPTTPPAAAATKPAPAPAKK
jgi:hypothetical protein